METSPADTQENGRPDDPQAPAAAQQAESADETAPADAPRKETLPGEPVADEPSRGEAVTQTQEATADGAAWEEPSRVEPAADEALAEESSPDGPAAEGASPDTPAPAESAPTESSPTGPATAEPAPADAPARAAEEAATVEAILFAADSPLPPGKIAQVAQLPQRAVRDAIGTLNERYLKTGAAFRIEEIAGGFQMLTLSQYHDVLQRLHAARAESRLSQPALETLAIVAYRQPVLRADIEAIRGVACGEVLRGLMEKQLVRIDGRAQVLGRPLLYGTTKRFLEVFGLASLADLPKAEELRAPTTPPAAAPAASAASAPAADPAAPPTADPPAPAAEAPANAPTEPAPGAYAADASPTTPAEVAPVELPVSNEPPGLRPGADLDNTAGLTDVMEKSDDPA